MQDLIDKIHDIYKAKLLFVGLTGENKDDQSHDRAFAAQFKTVMNASMAKLIGFDESSFAPTETGIAGSIQSSGTNAFDPITSFGDLGQTFISQSATYWSTTLENYFEQLKALAWETFGISVAAGITGSLTELYILATAGPQIGKPAGAVIITIGQSLANLRFQLEKALMSLFMPLGTALVTVLLGVGFY